MATHIEDLDALEISFLGVLSLGLPPSQAAGDETFRVDHCAAVVEGLRESGNGQLYLRDGGPAIGALFGKRLREAIDALGAKGLVSTQPGGMPAAPGGFEPGLLIDVVNPDEHPTILDRTIGQECLDLLLGIADVYPFLMSQYARAGEFWRKARAEGYAN